MLRIYQFLNNNRPIEEDVLIRELEIGTPNEELRNRIKSLENELQNSQDEIQALRESSLQMQLDSSDQLEQRDLENKP